MNILQHLKDREIIDFRHIILGDECCYFMLYNLSGQIVGTQRYSPIGIKNCNNATRLYWIEHDKNQLKYLPFILPSQLAVWGLHTYDVHKPLYIVEGVFDAAILHNLGLSAIAVLGNDPKDLKSWLRTLHNYKIVIPDNDSTLHAGDKLHKYGDEVIFLPQEYNDLNEMGTKNVQAHLYSIQKTHRRRIV